MSNSFKNLFLLDKKLIFLNHGSFGACPKSVFKSYHEWQLKLENQPVAFLDQARDFNKHMKKPRTFLAKELGVKQNDLVGVTNATSGLNAVAQSISLKKDDEILTSDHEYGALEKTWAYVAKKNKSKVIKVRVPLPLISEDQFVETFKDKMTNKTKILFISHITSPTALVFPLKKLIKEANKRGIISIIDGAHAPGHIKLNITNLNVDYYSGNCHKWMMAPKGSAFLWANKNKKNILEPLVISHGWLPNNYKKIQKGEFTNTRFIDNFEVQGTRDPSAWLTIPDAIKFIKDKSYSKAFSDSAELAYKTAIIISRLTKIPLLANQEFLAPQMISIPVPKCNVYKLKKQLLEKFNIEIPVIKWKNKCFVRISIQIYNNEIEANKLIKALVVIFKL
jgi:isopenicillin-N epimerase